MYYFESMRMLCLLCQCTFRSHKMHNGVIVSEEVDFINTQLLGSHLLDEVLDDLIVTSLQLLKEVLVVL